MDEEERVIKGDDVIVDLDASLEDLYMGGSLKVIPSRICNVRTCFSYVLGNLHTSPGKF